MKEISYYKYHDKGSDNLLKKQHTHNSSMEILHVIKGNGVITINDSLYPLTDNTIYFIRPMVLHFSAPENSQKYFRSVVNIPVEYLNRLCEITGFKEVLNMLYDNVCTVLDSASSDITDEQFFNLKKEDRSEISMAILTILKSLTKIKKEQYALNNQITDIISYINSNLSEKITLEDICDYAHISKYYLCHVFKKTTNMSIMNYILNQRIALAKNLMITSDKSISEIAILAGFSCFSYFSRMFKKSEQISPREFRNKYKRPIS